MAGWIFACQPVPKTPAAFLFNPKESTGADEILEMRYLLIDMRGLSDFSTVIAPAWKLAQPVLFATSFPIAFAAQRDGRVQAQLLRLFRVRKQDNRSPMNAGVEPRFDLSRVMKLPDHAFRWQLFGVQQTGVESTNRHTGGSRSKRQTA